MYGITWLSHMDQVIKISSVVSVPTMKMSLKMVLESMGGAKLKTPGDTAALHASIKVYERNGFL